MEMRALRYFLAVAETGSFSVAAGLMHVAQPAISRQIQALEQEFRVSLLKRTTRGAELTPQGQLLYDRARPLVEGFDDLAAEMRAQRDRPRQKVRIGVPPTCAEDHGVQLFEMLSAALPDAEIEMTEGLSRFLPDLLRDGGVDVIISLHEQHTDQIQFQLIEREPMVFFAPAGHPLLGDRTPSLPLSALADVPLVLSTGFLSLVQNFARDYGLAVSCHMQIDSIAATRRILSTSGSGTIWPLSIAEAAQKDGFGCFRLIDPAPMRSLFLGRARDTLPKRAGEVIEQFLKLRRGQA